MLLHAEPAAGHRVALAGEHARPDYFGHPHARNARRRIPGIPQAQRTLQADPGRDAFERGQHLGSGYQ